MPIPGVIASGYTAAAAMVASLLTSGAQGWDTGLDTAFTTASITPGTDCALVLTVAAVGGSASLFTPSPTCVSSGTGPTWTRQTFSTNAANNSGAAVWTAVIGGSSLGSFTVTVDYDSTKTSGSHSYSIHKLTGHNTTTPFGGKIATTAQAGNGAVTATLDAAPVAADITVAMCIADVAAVGGASTFGTGTWTDTAHGAASPVVSWNTGYRTGSTSTSVPWADVNGGDGVNSSAQCAIVVKAA